MGLLTKDPKSEDIEKIIRPRDLRTETHCFDPFVTPVPAIYLKWYVKCLIGFKFYIDVKFLTKNISFYISCSIK